MFRFVIYFLLARCVCGRCCEGQEIRVAGLSSHWPPWWSWDGVNPPEGFNAATLRLIEEHTGYRIRYIEIDADPADYVQGYESMILDGTVDMGIGIRSPYDRREFIFSVPLHYGSVRCLAHKEENLGGILRFLRPFSVSLWLALSGGIFMLAFGIIFLRALSGRRVTIQYSLKAMYGTWAAFLGGEDQEWSTGPARVMRLSLFFLIFISAATYTANLAAFFVKPDFTYHGPLSMADLSKSRVCSANEQFGWMAVPFTQEVIYPPADFAAGKSNEQLQEYCTHQVVSGNVDAVCDVSGTVEPLLSSHCNDLWMVPNIDFAPFSTNWIARQDNLEMMQNMSHALQELQLTPSWTEMRATGLHLDHTCDDEELSDTSQITLTQQRGVFLHICVALCFLSLVCDWRAGPLQEQVCKRSISRRPSNPVMQR